MNYSALAKQYEDDGFLVIKEFYTRDEIAEIERELDRHIRRIDPARAPENVVYESGSEKKIRNIFHLHRSDPYFASLAESQRLTGLGRTILRDEIVLISVELFAKPARVGSEVPYHQDNAYFNLVPDQAFTCWIALADATEQNGCVRYIEGSHKFGNLPHRASGVKGNSMRLTELPDGAGREVSGIVPRGGALIHHCNTIHRSEPNRSEFDRPGLLFVYKAAGCQNDETLAANYNAARVAVGT